MPKRKKPKHRHIYTRLSATAFRCSCGSVLLKGPSGIVHELGPIKIHI